MKIHISVALGTLYDRLSDPVRKVINTVSGKLRLCSCSFPGRALSTKTCRYLLTDLTTQEMSFQLIDTLDLPEGARPFPDWNCVPCVGQMVGSQKLLLQTNVTLLRSLLSVSAQQECGKGKPRRKVLIRGGERALKRLRELRMTEAATTSHVRASLPGIVWLLNLMGKLGT